ncbi:glycosyltransferase [Saccharococcus thermophilus]|uniref:Glycosyltransferase involved in cell wall biosynthesis n=1 Tax=Saccharococcus thermophilus TaxID=29396 RepID=A0A846MIE0_9BACL|nr:glycosyltransferase [Saccharococcus thermophilus]NIK13945.1 glycosyltransferase involved in cell wall biosynthesis [Saccharococcus thermophilus]
MNDKKIAFIYCVNNRALYEESVRYVKSLHVPEGYEIELIAIEGASSITSGYNQGMRQTNAKYKVYLHQDVFIVNKNFLYDIIALFEKYPKLGMIGVAGAKTIPKNGIWWESTQRFGKVYDSHTGEMKLLSFKDTELDYEPVQAIDGLIMITQYDIPWREDLFTGWHFYDLSQCQEFLLTGYDVGVVCQNEPWCVHDCGIVNVKNGFDDDRKKFIDVYGENVQRLNKKFLPLVSILIPTYNRPHYFELALQSALNQTYENIEIIVCDDSTNDETEKLVTKYTSKYDNLTYIKNRTRLGQFENDIKLFNLAKGEYINYLMDDDLFHPQKIEKMMNYYLNDQKNEITLVTSHRQLIDGNGSLLKDFASTKRLFETDTIIDGKVLGEYILKTLINCIGEPTTVLFRKRDLDEPFGTFSGREYLCNVDLASWFNLLFKGKAVYISETLSYFRIHDNQQLQSAEMLLNGTIDYAHMIMESRKKGLLQKDRDYELTLKNWFNYTQTIANSIINSNNIDRINELQNYYLLMEEEYNKLIQPKVSVALETLQNTYDSKEKNLIIFFVPGEDGITGGILSIYSIYEETKKLKHIHNCETIMCTLPNDSILLKNTNFENNVSIYPFELVMNYFEHIEKCIIHIPECYTVNFLNNISAVHQKKLKKIPSLQINLLIQNVDLAPARNIIFKLFEYTRDVTCTTAHRQYSTREYRERFGIPLHYLSVWVSQEQYKFKNYEDKENLMVVSPDPHPLKEEILNRIKKRFPSLEIVIIRNLKYEEYKDIISRAKWALTFGEGLDGYFVETVFSGGISFAVYNSNFFTSEFKSMKTVYQNYTYLLNEICKDIEFLDDDREFKTHISHPNKVKTKDFLFSFSE